MFQVIHNFWAPVGPFIQTRRAFGNQTDAMRHLVTLNDDRAYVYNLRTFQGIELPEARKLLNQK